MVRWNNIGKIPWIRDFGDTDGFLVRTDETEEGYENCCD